MERRFHNTWKKVVFLEKNRVIHLEKLGIAENNLVLLKINLVFLKLNQTSLIILFFLFLKIEKLRFSFGISRFSIKKTVDILVHHFESGINVVFLFAKER